MNLQDIALEMGIDQLPEEERVAALARINGMFHKRLGVRLSQELSHDQLAKFMEQADKDPQMAVGAFEALVPNLDEIMQQELKALRDDLMAFM